MLLNKSKGKAMKSLTPDLTKPLRTMDEFDGTITIIDADGWHVCTMEEKGGEGECKAKMICAAFNATVPA